MSNIPVMGNCEIHSQVADHRTLFSLFKAFAVTAGWTLQVDQPDANWADTGGGVYGWVGGGDEDYFEIRSTGDGTQAMQFRFRLQHSNADPLYRYMWIGGFKGTEGYDTTSSVHPYQRNDSAEENWNGQGADVDYQDIPTGPIPTVWFFGDVNRLMCIMQCDDDYILSFFVGSIVRHGTTMTDGYTVGNQTGGQRWYNHPNQSWYDYVSQYTDRLLLDGVPKPQYLSFYCNTRKTNVVGYRGYPPVFIASKANPYSSRRPITQQSFWRILGDLREQEVGLMPFGRIQHDGLKIGEEVQYGGERYLTFPRDLYNVNTLGIAVRIA